ncbi:MAG: response regulator [SAR324 cluster bacterium]|nr:response regulator [SAR324 cluster bacterium]
MTSKILVVDDERDLEILFSLQFRKEINNQELEFHFANDGMEALGILKNDTSHQIELVLTDIRMPKMDGLSLVSKIKEGGYLLEVIIVSAHGDMQNIRSAMNFGAFDFLIKPFDIQDIKNTIQRALDHLHQFKEEVNKREQAERALKEQQKEQFLLITAVEQAAESIVITNAGGIIKYVNPAFEKRSGYCCEEVIGKNPRILKSGKQSANFYKKMWDILKSGKIWHGQIVNKTKNGTLYEEELSISPIRDETEKIVNYVAVKRDVSRELELEKQLRQAQKMEAIGTLAGGIAHDFNNLLFAMLGYITMASSELPEDSPMREDLEEAALAGRRAKSLIQQILTFSRQQETKHEPVEVVPIIKEALKLLRASIPATIEMSAVIASEKMVIAADPTQMHQVVVSLCANAFQAMGENGGQLEVQLKKTELTPLFASRHAIDPGGYVKLTVRDTGPGIDPAIQERIFDPFFTTKEVGEGIGMGLAVVHGIVQDHGGIITVDSQLGKGSAFDVFFPMIIDELNAEEETEAAYAHSGGRILVVDDEPMLVRMEQHILERKGYDVVTATDPNRALELFRTEPEQFSLVITDQTMTGMTGTELAKELRTIQKDIPILLLTGYRLMLDEQQIADAGIREVVLKPIESKQFSQIVARVLDGTAKNGCVRNRN